MTRFLLSTRAIQGATRRCGSQSAQSRAALDFARIQFARVQDLVESKAIAGRTTTPGKTPSTWAKPRSSRIKPPRVRALESGVHVDPFAIDGRAGHRLVDVGNVVTANNSTLLNIERLDPIYADSPSPENDFSEVQRHTSRGILKVEVRLPMNWTSRSLDNSRFSITPCKAAAGPFCFARRYPTAATGYGQGVCERQANPGHDAGSCARARRHPTRLGERSVRIRC